MTQVTKPRDQTVLHALREQKHKDLKEKNLLSNLATCWPIHFISGQCSVPREVTTVRTGPVNWSEPRGPQSNRDLPSTGQEEGLGPYSTYDHFLVSVNHSDPRPEPPVLSNSSRKNPERAGPSRTLC